MIEMIEITTLAFFFSGIFFFIIGTLGLLRLPDVYTKLHATTKCDTLGAGLVFIGTAIYKIAGGEVLAASKVILIMVFTFLASPTAAHAIAKAAYKSGEKMCRESVIDEYREIKGELNEVAS